MSTSKKTPWALIAIIIVGVLAICLAVGSYFKGKKDAQELYMKQAVEVDARMDSLRHIEFRLRDSLLTIQRQRNEITVIRTVFKTVYDTVQIKTAPVSIVSGLNNVANLPIPPEK